MGWVDTLIGAASLSMEIAQVNQLNQLKQQGAEHALINQITKYLREQIFNYKQQANKVLSFETQNKRITAGGLAVLSSRLEDSGLDPSLFSELSDKEYCADVINMIQTNYQRIYNEISPEDQGKVAALRRYADCLPEYQYFLDNYNDWVVYKESLDQRGEYEKYSQFKGVGFGCGFIIVAMLIMAVILSATNNSSTGLVLGLVIVAAPVIYLIAQRNKWESANNQVTKMEKELDINLLNKVDNSTQGDIEKVRELHKEAEYYVNRFFEGSTLLSS